jgi:hypothetical protein
MKELPMPIRFSTEAANADFLRDDAETMGASEVGADGTPREPSERKPKRESRAPEAKSEAKPGKDVNATGIVKDQDADKP